MSKRKFGIDSDDRMSMLVPSMTEAQIAGLPHQDELPANLKCLAPLLESIRQAYEAAAPPPPNAPVKVRNEDTARFTATDFTFRFVKQQNLRAPAQPLKP
jgi:hypothetical protein